MLYDLPSDYNKHHLMFILKIVIQKVIQCYCRAECKYNFPIYKLFSLEENIGINVLKCFKFCFARWLQACSPSLFVCAANRAGTLPERNDHCWERSHMCESYIIPVRLGGILTKCLLNGKLGKIMALVMIRSRLSASDHSDECVGW